MNQITRCPMGGFCRAATAISIIGASLAGIPVAHHHTITGAIVGVGATRPDAVRWGWRQHRLGLGLTVP